ncbi:MAG: hypothetical protein ABII80_02700 [bacterium]
MGAMTEINSIVRFPGDFDLSKLEHGLIVDLVLERERVLPLRIALLYFHTDWNFLGFCRVLSITQKEGKTYMQVEVLTVFNEQEQATYKAKFVEAGKYTGETK